MEITEVKVFSKASGPGGEKLKAYASVTFDGVFVVRGIKIIEGIKGFFVAMPSRKLQDGTFKDIAHPLNNETRAVITEKVLDKYYETEGLEIHRAQ